METSESEPATYIEAVMAQERVRASDPETDGAALYHLAGLYPAEVLANPGLALLSLEDPRAWLRTSRRARLGVAKLALAPLLHSGAGQRTLRLFAAACAERIVDGWAPSTKARLLCTPERVRAVATAARCHAWGMVGPGDLEAVRVVCDAWRQINIPLDRPDGRALDAGSVLLVRGALVAAKRVSIAMTTRHRLETSGDGSWASEMPDPWEWQVTMLRALLEQTPPRPGPEAMTGALAVLRGSA